MPSQAFFDGMDLGTLRECKEFFLNVLANLTRRVANEEIDGVEMKHTEAVASQRLAMVKKAIGKKFRRRRKAVVAGQLITDGSDSVSTEIALARARSCLREGWPVTFRPQNRAVALKHTVAGVTNE